MKITTQSSIIYENPPIDEMVCGVRFEPIKALQSGHFGILWQKLRNDFPKTEDQIPMRSVTREDLENPETLLLPRVWFVHRNENEIIQVQRDCFLYNWRKRQPNDEYPGYAKVVENFERYLSLFQKFLAEENLGNLVGEGYELTYIDLIPKGQGWESPGNLEKVFSNLLSLARQGIPLSDVRSVNWQIILDLPDGLGHLKIALRNANHISDNQQLLHIEFTAASNRPYQPMRAWFQEAHNAITKLFSSLVSDEIQGKFWGRQS